MASPPDLLTLVKVAGYGEINVFAKGRATFYGIYPVTNKWCDVPG